MQYSERDIHALRRVKVEQQDFVQFLHRYRDDLHSEMEATADPQELQALRGEARGISRILALIDEATDASERLNVSRSPTRDNTVY